VTTQQKTLSRTVWFWYLTAH